MWTRSMALGLLLLLASGGTGNRGAAAFSPSTAVHDAHTKPTAQAYTNGESPLANHSWDHPHQPNAQAIDPFEAWGTMRLGMGDGPGSNPEGCFWVGGGSLYEAYSGKQLAIFEGFDIGKGVRLGDNHIRQLSRKIFWFRDPVTGEIMQEFEGKPVKPIQYDSQMIDYHRGDDGSITYSVEASLRLLKDQLPNLEITSQMAGPHCMMINIPVFLDIPIAEERGGGRYQAWEFYDYNFDPTFPADRPPTAVWCRQGSVPPFNTDSKAVLRFTGYRVDSFDELPERMKEEVERAYPHFKTPPRDEREVEEIQSLRKSV
ncbi:hypothetical protein ACHAXT_008770 [Thalassiosira profunda]